VSGTRYKSKTAATWIALLGGSVGLHRFYLFGWRDGWGWLFPWPSLVGLVGVLRMRTLGMDDQLAWLLIPWLGLALAVAMGMAIAYGLTPDERWDARFNPGGGHQPMNALTVLGVALSLIIGAAILMATIAFTAQRYFEYQALQEPTPASMAHP